MRRVLLLVVVLAGCDAYDTDLGATPFLCGDDTPRCPDGYSCMTDGLTGKDVCVSASGELGTDFNCADDSANEPNNELDQATSTGIDAAATFTAENQSVCPAGDRDLFAIQLTAVVTNVDVEISFDTGGADLQMALTNAGAVPISVGMGDAGARMLHAGAKNLPAGMYYVSVSAPVSDTISVNNYKLTVTTSAP